MKTLITTKHGNREQHRHFFRTLNRDQETVYLTDRELQVVTGIGLGHGNKQMAFDLGISKKTVEKFRQTVYRKLRTNAQADVIHFALARGIVQNKYHNEPTQ